MFLVLSDTCTAGTQSIGRISPPFEGSMRNWVDNQGQFLLSNSGEFAFGFSTRPDITSFLLGIIHVDSLRVVWTANIGSSVTNSDKFVFGNDGNAYLESGSSVVWSTNTTGNGGATIELQDTGNLILLSNDSRPLWQSFDNPTENPFIWSELYRWNETNKQSQQQ
ncbi:G-type lectin S-receptor-like serine/threonine-protein kinase SD2-5 [Cinnamomum micranthum f. kanehirae]|uniref:G-type lectin S-receptor-like serine/threonine-protein kinase SD2-5 n=1 Tax=Cinnamomum micranthum f. kanehirae TaxID=337451 RepID=A0A443NX58_9MAGN|nr:G-type lectin S-receptor-like serine/threonine-protein kinase SD2-5 [Cinnamomum micranthum f. kanehirae]